MNVDLVNTHYYDFQTIDWLKDLMRDLFRHRLLRAKTHQSFLNKILMYHDAWSGWLCVLLVGLSAGVIAAVIDIGTNWMSHLKHGICLNAFWLNREQCCMYLNRKIKAKPRGKCRTSRRCHNYALDLFSYVKSTIDLCYGILAGLQPT
jgi:chloride channel 3/4/5